MRSTRSLIWSLMFLAGMGTALSLYSCRYLEPAAVAAGNAVIDAKLADGTMTVEEARALREAYEGGDWWELLLTIGGVVLGVGVPANLAATKVWRGGINKRKGSTPGPNS